MNDHSSARLALAFQLATLDVLKAKGYLASMDLEAMADAAFAFCRSGETPQAEGSTPAGVVAAEGASDPAAGSRTGYTAEADM